MLLITESQLNSIIENLQQHENQLKSNLTNLLSSLNIENFKIIGYGQHGVVAYLIDNNKCLKLTNSSDEEKIVEKISDGQYETFPKIYGYNSFNGLFYYIRDCFEPINDELGEEIAENMEEIYDFFGERRNWNAKKSNTNLSYYFDEEFLTFLSKFKKDLYKLGLLPYKWDIDALSVNLYKRNDGSFVLADF